MQCCQCDEDENGDGEEYKDGIEGDNKDEDGDEDEY